MSEKLHVDLSGAPQTMLATFYAKALDADLPKPILGDRWAKEIVDRIDYDWSKTSITKANSPSVTTRSAHFDKWARQFLAVHPVPPWCISGVGWTPAPSGWIPAPASSGTTSTIPMSSTCVANSSLRRDNYHVIAASVTDPAWLAEVRSDRPTLMVGEGLTMYLTRVRRSRAAAPHRRRTFPSGELQFDAFNRLGIKSQWMNAVVRRSGSTLYWGINGPDDIIEAVPGVRLLAWESPFDSAVSQTWPGTTA